MSKKLAFHLLHTEVIGMECRRAPMWKSQTQLVISATMRVLIAKLISVKHTYTNRKVGVLDPHTMPTVSSLVVMFDQLHIVYIELSLEQTYITNVHITL